MRSTKTALLWLWSLLLFSADRAFADNRQSTDSAKTFKVSSSHISTGARVPKQYTGEGADQSPPLQWSQAPSATKSLAITCTDPDAPGGTWWHWIIFNIPITTAQLQASLNKTATLKNGVVQGTNDFKNVGYNGPMPPPGRVHRYQFNLMALNTVLTLRPGCNKDDFKRAIQGHVIAQTEITPVYSR